MCRSVRTKTIVILTQVIQWRVEHSAPPPRAYQFLPNLTDEDLFFFVRATAGVQFLVLLRVV